jgi:acylphosphatase
MAASADLPFAAVRFSGHVQGVGFRYSALQVAREFDVVGFVQNLPDGKVLLEVEGDLAAIDEFLAALQERMRGYIRGVERTGGRRAPQFSGFGVR